MKWQRAAAKRQSRPPLPLPDKIWQILEGRGYRTQNEIEKVFQPKLRELAHPYSIDQMDIAVDRLLLALQNQEKILMYSDYDLDGTPGLALLKDGLERLGFAQLLHFQPSRLRDGYGVHSHKIREFAEQGVSLVVTIDVGITDIAAIQLANSLGIDVIVTDHHLPKEELPPAFAILNPNKGSCGSHLQHLCGAGVAFYLVLALKMEMQKQGRLKADFNPKELLDLFALATITDMVPMVNENRVLVKHGLIQLAQTKRPGLKRLFIELGFYNKKLSSTDIAFRIAPKLNALTRLDEGVRALDVLLADESNSQKLVDEALLVNQRRILLQEQAKKIASDLVAENKIESFIWIHSHEFHPGVISLIASDLMNTYGVPAFVGSLSAEGRIVGSARSPSDQYNLQNILSHAESALVKFGGHKMAAGFEVESSKAEIFREHLVDFLTQDLSLITNDKVTSFYDTEVEIKDLNAEFMNWLENMGPFGVQFETPKLLLENARIVGLKKLKGKYLKYTLTQGGQKIEAPWFSGGREFPEGSQVDVLFEPQWNEYQGRKTIQALVFDMQPSDTRRS